MYVRKHIFNIVIDIVMIHFDEGLKFQNTL